MVAIGVINLMLPYETQLNPSNSWFIAAWSTAQSFSSCYGYTSFRVSEHSVSMWTWQNPSTKSGVNLCHEQNIVIYFYNGHIIRRWMIQRSAANTFLCVGMVKILYQKTKQISISKSNFLNLLLFLTYCEQRIILLTLIYK